jgi:hypothetical protein
MYPAHRQSAADSTNPLTILFISDLFPSPAFKSGINPTHAHFNGERKKTLTENGVQIKA